MDCQKIWTMFCSDVERVDIGIIKDSIKYMGNLHDNKRNNITPQIAVQVIDFCFLFFFAFLILFYFFTYGWVVLQNRRAII